MDTGPVCHMVCLFTPQLNTGTKDKWLPLSRQKKMTFLDEIAGNMSNKCTFINPNSP